MKKLSLVLVIVAVAAVTLTGTAAVGGGFATVGLSSLPDGTQAGATWSPELTVKAHGVTPISGISPIVRIRNGSEVREFAAKPAGKTGVYRADVVFPTGGTWTYEIWDGYAQTHTFKPVEIAAPSGGSFPLFELGLGAVLAFGLAAATILLLRRRRPEPRPIYLKEAA